MPPRTQSAAGLQKHFNPKNVPRQKSKLFNQYSNSMLESFEYVTKCKHCDETEDKLVFCLPISPISSNTCMHWRTKNELKKQYRSYFEQMLYSRFLPQRPSEPWEIATLTVKAFVKAKNDRDNLVSRIKQSIDLIVRSGYLVDDGPERLHWAGFPEQVVNRKTPAYIVITLTKWRDEP